MEQQQKAEEKKPEAEQISGQDQVQKPDPGMDANAGGAAGPANGDAGKLEADAQPLDHNTGDNNSNGNGLGQNKPTLNHTRSKKSVRWSEDLVVESPSSRTMHYAGAGGGSNPYVASSPASSYSTSLKDSVSTVRDVLGRWGRKVGEATRKAEDLAGNTWQHLKTAPSIADAALGRIAQGTKVLAEGGYEKIFRQSFETVPEEQLLNSYACYLSTSAGPVMGILYVSTAKLAFCSDNPLSYKSGDRTEWSYYKESASLAFYNMQPSYTISRMSGFRDSTVLRAPRDSCTLNLEQSRGFPFCNGKNDLSPPPVFSQGIF